MHILANEHQVSTTISKWKEWVVIIPIEEERPTTN
jgi:hypothetical protein